MDSPGKILPFYVIEFIHLILEEFLEFHHEIVFLTYKVADKTSANVQTGQKLFDCYLAMLK